MTRFMKLDNKGRVIDVAEIKQSDMLACPHCIIVAEHYRDDGSCRCNDSKHVEMKEWGYKWDGSKWR